MGEGGEELLSLFIHGLEDDLVEEVEFPFILFVVLPEKAAFAFGEPFQPFTHPFVLSLKLADVFDQTRCCIVMHPFRIVVRSTISFLRRPGVPRTVVLAQPL